MNDDIKRILSTNVDQAAFYESSSDSRIANLPMAIWRFFRRRLYGVMDRSGIRADIDSFHMRWLGDLEGKKVLDLGCYQGNRLSMYLAEASADYVGVDLSATALEKLEASFRKRGITSARVQAVDVLSDDFQESGFDIVYAQGVLHHFRPIDTVLSLLSERLSPGGFVVSLDPLQTSLLTRVVRACYHPFRVDREWEWPFTRDSFEVIEKDFVISEVQGFLGWSKWAVPLAFVSPRLAASVAKILHGWDLERASRVGIPLFGCLQVAMKMEKRC